MLGVRAGMPAAGWSSRSGEGEHAEEHARRNFENFAHLLLFVQDDLSRQRGFPGLRIPQEANSACERFGTFLKPAHCLACIHVKMFVMDGRPCPPQTGSCPGWRPAAGGQRLAAGSGHRALDPCLGVKNHWLERRLPGLLAVKASIPLRWMSRSLRPGARAAAVELLRRRPHGARSSPVRGISLSGGPK